jgi:hypothetical protein
VLLAAGWLSRRAQIFEKCPKTKIFKPGNDFKSSLKLFYDITNTLPYVKFDSSTEFNPKDKTITLYYSGGACSSSSETYQAVDGYGAVKFRLIKGWETYSWDDDGKNIGCHVKTYDIVNDREVLNVAESGAVDLATGELINRI